MGLIEAAFAGAAQGFSNATQQNNAMEIGSINRGLDFSFRELMDARVAERNATEEKSRYDRGRGDVKADYDLKRADTKADAETKHGYDLDLQRERNKGYATARASGGTKSMAGYTEWKKDNPDGTYEDFMRTVSSAKDNQEKRITETAMKLKESNVGMTTEEALAEATQLVTRIKSTKEKKTPQKNWNEY